MKTLNDYLAMSYRMEIVEDKDEGGFVFLSGGIRNITLVKRFFHLGEASSSP